MDFELRAYIEDRRAELKECRRSAAKRTSLCAADCAIHELDRLEGWLNLFGQRPLGKHLAHTADEQAKTWPAPGARTITEQFNGWRGARPPALTYLTVLAWAIQECRGPSPVGCICCQPSTAVRRPAVLVELEGW